MEDFLKRVDTKKVNKKVIESLIKAGAFDSVYSDYPPNYARALAMNELLSNKGNGKVKKSNKLNAVSLFF